MIAAEALDQIRQGIPTEVVSRVRQQAQFTIVRIADWPAGSDPSRPPHFQTLVADTGVHLSLSEVAS